MRRTLTKRRIDQARALYVGSDDLSLHRIACMLQVDPMALSEIAKAEGWFTARISARRWLAEDAARRTLQTADDCDDGATYAALLRRSLLVLSERILARCAGLLEEPDRTPNDLRCVANAAESAQRMARLELGLPTSASAMGVEIAAPGAESKDAWAVLRELSLGKAKLPDS